MLNLLTSFSFGQIITFTILLIFAIKEIIELVDWVKGKVSKRDEVVISEKDEKEDMYDHINALDDTLKEFSEQLDALTDKVNLLIKSDRDDIKAFITKEHHYFCYQKGWIDDYSLDCLEKRYSHYVEEKGNSFIKQLMTELRDLPKQPPPLTEEGEE